MTLLERLQAATGPSRELDAEIARLFGYATVGDRLVDPDLGEIIGGIPEFTNSLDAILAEVPEGHAAAIGTMAFKDSHQLPWATIWTPDGHPQWHGEAPTPALALCIAVVKAKEAKDE